MWFKGAGRADADRRDRFSGRERVSQRGDFKRDALNYAVQAGVRACVDAAARQNLVLRPNQTEGNLAAAEVDADDAAHAGSSDCSSGRPCR